MKCKNCGSTIVLKYTNHIDGKLSKYWECPVCGAFHEHTSKNGIGEVLLK